MRQDIPHTPEQIAEVDREAEVILENARAFAKAHGLDPTATATCLLQLAFAKAVVDHTWREAASRGERPPTLVSQAANAKGCAEQLRDAIAIVFYDRGAKEGTIGSQAAELRALRRALDPNFKERRR